MSSIDLGYRDPSRDFGRCLLNVDFPEVLRLKILLHLAVRSLPFRPSIMIYALHIMALARIPGRNAHAFKPGIPYISATL